MAQERPSQLPNPAVRSFQPWAEGSEANPALTPWLVGTLRDDLVLLLRLQNPLPRLSALAGTATHSTGRHAITSAEGQAGRGCPRSPSQAPLPPCPPAAPRGAAEARLRWPGCEGDSWAAAHTQVTGQTCQRGKSGALLGEQEGGVHGPGSIPPSGLFPRPSPTPMENKDETSVQRMHTAHTHARRPYKAT